jgi:uncharacterized protein
VKTRSILFFHGHCSEAAVPDFIEVIMETPDLFKLNRDQTIMLKLVQTRMPFGRYEGRLLIDLPEPYVIWFRQQGFPDGELGKMLAILYEIKANGLEYLFDPLRNQY